MNGVQMKNSHRSQTSSFKLIMFHPKKEKKIETKEEKRKPRADFEIRLTRVNHLNDDPFVYGMPYASENELYNIFSIVYRTNANTQTFTYPIKLH